MKVSKENLGRIFMIGITGKSLSADEKKLLKELNIGGIILFKRNYESLNQLVELINEIKAATDRPFIGVDQEGGKVLRFGEPFTQFPANNLLGEAYKKTKSSKLVKDYAKTLSLELGSAGINLCFVPVVDVLTNKMNDVIGERAFSEDIKVVSKLSKVVIDEFKKNNVMSCAKHFPGHGDTILDSHKELPRVEHELDFLRKRELIPFKKSIESDVPMIMTSHIVYEAIDPIYPVTLSKKVIGNVLRDELDFENLIISDDLDMQAISNNYELPGATCLALRAGVDMVMICHSIDKMREIFDFTYRATLEEPEFAVNVSQSIRWVEDFRLKYCSSEKIELKIAKNSFDKKRSDKLVSEIEKYS